MDLVERAEQILQETGSDARGKALCLHSMADAVWEAIQDPDRMDEVIRLADYLGVSVRVLMVLQPRPLPFWWRTYLSQSLDNTPRA